MQQFGFHRYGAVVAILGEWSAIRNLALDKEREVGHCLRMLSIHLAV